jgi:alpha/beta superfamily hydrolase
MIFNFFLPKIIGKAKLRKNLITTLVSEKKRHFFRRKLAKIAENCDHNIDPWR